MENTDIRWDNFSRDQRYQIAEIAGFTVRDSEDISKLEYSKLRPSIQRCLHSVDWEMAVGAPDGFL